MLKSGKYLPFASEIPQTDYRISIAKSNPRPQAQLYAFNIRDEIPVFSIPLQSPDAEPELNLQSLLMGIYDRARFDLTLDYDREFVSRFKEEDRVWADELLRETGRR